LRAVEIGPLGVSRIEFATTLIAGVEFDLQDTGSDQLELELKLRCQAMPGLRLAWRIVTHWPLCGVNDEVCAVTPELDPMPDQIEQTLRSLGGQLPGCVFRPGQDGYTAATAIWAKPVDTLPRAIVHCWTTEDVQLAIRAARDCGLPLSVCGGGQHWASRALCASVVIDLSGVNRVSVAADHRSAMISGGARAADVAAATDPLHVAAVTGTCSTVGMPGLTLGGGYEPLIGRFGLAPDNLLVFPARSGNVGAASENGFRLCERIDQQARADAGEIVQTVAHGGHDAEVSAAAAQRPEQLPFIVAAGDDDPNGRVCLCRWSRRQTRHRSPYDVVRPSGRQRISVTPFSKLEHWSPAASKPCPMELC
jgi:FAD binding domain